MTAMCFGCQRLHVRKLDPCPICGEMLGRCPGCKRYDTIQGYTHLYCTDAPAPYVGPSHFMGKPPEVPS